MNPIPIEKLLRRADRNGPNGCWVWKGYLSKLGYGALTVAGKTWIAHRAIYVRLRGPVAAGLVLDHLCRNRACVNPDHLEPVTQRENVYRSDNQVARNVVATHCARGHAFTPENARRDSGGSRHCRTCHRDRARMEYREQAKAAGILGRPSASDVNAIKTRCANGHPLTGSNLYQTPHGKRECRTCRAARKARPEEREKARLRSAAWRARRQEV